LAALQLRVVGDADPGKFGDLLAPETGYAATDRRIREDFGARGELRAP
jgi:hypothetical protein